VLSTVLLIVVAALIHLHLPMIVVGQSELCMTTWVVVATCMGGLFDKL